MDAQWVQKVDQKISDMEIRLAVAERDISVIKSTLDRINSNTTWIVRLLVGGMVAAILTFAIKGGLNI